MEKTAELQIPRLSSSKREGDTTASSITLEEKEAADFTGTDRDQGEITSSEGNQTTTDPTADTPAEEVENTDYITGFKLIVLLFSVTTFFFLLMLDMSIISTVSCASG